MRFAAKHLPQPRASSKVTSLDAGPPAAGGFLLQWRIPDLYDVQESE